MVAYAHMHTRTTLAKRGAKAASEKLHDKNDIPGSIKFLETGTHKKQ